MSDNKTLRTRHESHQYVITVMRDGVRKYISRELSKKINCTVLLNRAKRFQSEKQAKKYVLAFGVDEYPYKIVPITVEMNWRNNSCRLSK